MKEIEKLEFLAGGKAKGARKGLTPGSMALLAAVLVAAIALGLQLARQNMRQPTSGPASDFQLDLFDGGQFRLSDHRGQVVMLNFWASWCPPCRDEAPELQALYADYRDAGFTLVGVNMLESAPAKARAFIDEFGITYANGEDTGQRVTNLYHVEGPPESFLIDRRGNVRRFYLGSINYDTVSAAIEALLEETS